MVKFMPPDIAIINIHELVTLDSKFGVPRKGKMMSELSIINNGGIVALIWIHPTSSNAY